MTSLLPLLMVVIMFVCMAMLFNEGMWSNAVRLINVVTAALLATNFFEPLAQWFDSQMPAGTFAWDFICIWGLFAVFSGIFYLLTSFLSQVKVRFFKIADQIGSAVLALWISWVMVCFTMMTLHTAPLPRNFLFGGFKAENRMMMFAPDRQWLAFTQKMSNGAFAVSASSEERQQEKYMFDPNADFMPKYATRRSILEESMKKNHSIIVPVRRR
jgi:hypothetical protein